MPASTAPHCAFARWRRRPLPLAVWSEKCCPCSKQTTRLAFRSRQLLAPQSRQRAAPRNRRCSSQSRRPFRSRTSRPPTIISPPAASLARSCLSFDGWSRIEVRTWGVHTDNHILFAQFTIVTTYGSHHCESIKIYICVEPSVRGLRCVPLTECAKGGPERALRVLLVERLVDVRH